MVRKGGTYWLEPMLPFRPAGRRTAQAGRLCYRNDFSITLSARFEMKRKCASRHQNSSRSDDHVRSGERVERDCFEVAGHQLRDACGALPFFQFVSASGEVDHQIAVSLFYCLEVLQSPLLALSKGAAIEKPLNPIDDALRP